MKSIAIIRVDYVTSGAAARAVVSGLIVCPERRQHRIKQPRLLQSEKDRVGPEQRAQTSRAEQILCRPPGTLFRVWQTDLSGLPTSSFKRPQYVAHLRYLPSRERIKKGQHSALCRVVSRRLWNRDEP